MTPTDPQSGLSYWRSLEHLANSPQVQAQIEQEFPGYDPKSILSVSRRRFMKLMAASLGLAGLTLTGCRRWPKEVLAPYVSRPENRIPGVEEYYATVFELGGAATGVLAESYDGRPIKIEGNPSHPFARTFGGKLGASSLFAQASVLELYDPARSRGVLSKDSQTADWAAFDALLAEIRTAARGNGGAGLAILNSGSNGPTLQRLRNRLAEVFPQAKWYDYEPVNYDNQRAATQQVFGRALRPRLNLDKAEIIVSLDDDFLAPTHAASLRYANDWAQYRKSADQGRMSRMYMADTVLSITGSVADNRLPIRPSRLAAVAAALLAAVGGGSANGIQLDEQEQAWVDAAAADLKRVGGNAVVTVSPQAPVELQAVAFAINSRIGAIGSTIVFLPDPAGDQPGNVQGITELTAAMKAGQVKTLFILGGNPSYDAPADLGFADALANVPTSIHLSLYVNETSRGCKWHAPQAHYLEAWGDARAWDGTISIAQPLILPLFDGRSSIELIAQLLEEPETTGMEIVRRTLRGIVNDADFDGAWRRALHDGVVEGTAAQPVAVQARQIPQWQPAQVDGFELRFMPDYSVYDGRFTTNGWLLEAPDPITKLAWDNAALISYADARTLDVKDGDIIAITAGGRSIEIPVFVLPGQPRGVITLPLGYGRPFAGEVGKNIGFDVYPLRTSDAMYATVASSVIKPGRRHELVTTQHHHMLDDVGNYAFDKRIGEKAHSGKIVREGNFADYQARGARAFLPPDHHPTVELQLYQPPHQFNEPHAWGMSIDMTACIGCNACVVACQAENNVPIVGKENLASNREMHWLRIDRYFKSNGSTAEEKAQDPNPQIVHMPVMCVHCENAPCESVCPVAATTHDTEGLNVMVYNRCIGTRYCSNNCPYKVRRFNYFDWHSKDPRSGRFAMPWPGIPDAQQHAQVDKIRQMGFNPDVTIRMRGVMEKCTYCVQRIQAAKIRSKNQWLQGKRTAEEGADALHPSLVRDFEVVTACQQACPTEAIVFGNLNDPRAAVVGWQRNPRAYKVLEDLNTRPRTVHLAVVRNPASSGSHGTHAAGAPAGKHEFVRTDVNV